MQKEKAHGFGTTILVLFSILLLIIGKVNESSLSIFKSYFFRHIFWFLNFAWKASELSI